MRRKCRVSLYCVGPQIFLMTLHKQPFLPSILPLINVNQIMNACQSNYLQIITSYFVYICVICTLHVCTCDIKTNFFEHIYNCLSYHLILYSAFP